MTEINLKIDGMTCDSCSGAITRVISKKDYVSNTDVSWQDGTGKFEVDSEERKHEIVSTIERLGYKVTQ